MARKCDGCGYVFCRCGLSWPENYACTVCPLRVWLPKDKGPETCPDCGAPGVSAGPKQKASH